MANAAPAPTLLMTTLERVAKRTEAIFALGLVGIIAILLVPLPAGILSALIGLNLALSMLIFLVCIHVKEPLEFNAFPSLLLVTTMFRLGLNVASTKLILLTGTGGSVIEAMGHVVVGGNFVVGVVVFCILLVVQLAVVTKGAGRISEVAARFVLDAMPGKQMAIDADLNAGLINEKEARARREKIAMEAEFYGAMDGASKFVKGDAIAGLIITVTVICAGFVIGMAQMGLDASTSLKTFALLAIGDGLVSQIPSILITIGSGMIITKTRSEETAGSALAREVFLKPKPLAIAGGVIMAMGLIPGMPLLVFAAIGGGMMALAYTLRGAEGEAAEAKAKAEVSAQPQPEEKPEELLPSDRLGVEIGYRLIPLVDKDRGGQLLDRITTLRRQLAREGGLLVPPIRIKDNIQLPPNCYRILVHGQEMARYELFPERMLAIDGGGVSGALQGQTTKEPAFGLDATWIDSNRRGEAETLGWTVTDPASVFITHLTQVLRANAHQVLNREDVQGLLAALKKDAPALVKEIETGSKLGTVQKVLGHLLEERVPINNLEKILEAVADAPTADPALLAEQARSRMGRAVVGPHLDPQGRLNAIIFDPTTESRLSSSLGNSGAGQIAVSPAEASALIDQIGRCLQESSALGRDAVLLTTAGLRRQLRQITSRFHADLAVLSYSEIGTVPVEVVGTVALPKP
jgi:flagellar biosynthesis protein FlhA